MCDQPKALYDSTIAQKFEGGSRVTMTCTVEDGAGGPVELRDFSGSVTRVDIKSETSQHFGDSFWDSIEVSWCGPRTEPRTYIPFCRAAGRDRAESLSAHLCCVCLRVCSGRDPMAGSPEGTEPELELASPWELRPEGEAYQTFPLHQAGQQDCPTPPALHALYLALSTYHNRHHNHDPATRHFLPGGSR